MKPDSSSVDQQLAAISRGIFINRCLLIFIAICAGIPLFAPKLAARIAELSDGFWAACAPYASGVLGILLALVAVIVCAAYVVSKVAPAAPVKSERRPS
jgi:uncharacterized membrane protein